MTFIYYLGDLEPDETSTEVQEQATSMFLLQSDDLIQIVDLKAILTEESYNSLIEYMHSQKTSGDPQSQLVLSQLLSKAERTTVFYL